MKRKEKMGKQLRRTKRRRKRKGHGKKNLLKNVQRW